MDYDVLLRQVDAALADGDELDDIDERLIECSALSTEQKAAMWLYAFSAQQLPARHRFVWQHLSAAGLA